MLRGVAGSVVARLAVGGVRVWRRGGTAAASRVHHSWWGGAHACCACTCCACSSCAPSCWACGALVQRSSRSCGLRSSTSSTSRVCAGPCVVLVLCMLALSRLPEKVASHARVVVRNEKWPRDMHRELSIIALCPPIRHGYTSKQPTLPHKAYGAELC